MMYPGRFEIGEPLRTPAKRTLLHDHESIGSVGISSFGWFRVAWLAEQDLSTVVPRLMNICGLEDAIASVWATGANPKVGKPGDLGRLVRDAKRASMASRVGSGQVIDVKVESRGSITLAWEPMRVGYDTEPSYRVEANTIDRLCIGIHHLGEVGLAEQLPELFANFE